MMTEQQMRMMIEMFSNPMFKHGANEFLKIAQQQGMEAANKFWGISSENQAFPDVEKMMERMAEFYQTLGFVPQAKYDELMKQYAGLKAENQMLSDTIRELQQRFIAENGAKAQQAWQEIVDKQLEMSREVTKSFFDVLKQSSPEKSK
jgi:Tat protein secretion system quality control protein TatD with DNase activity